VTQAIDSVAALEWLKVEHDRNKLEFVWLNFSLSNAAADNWVAEHLSLPEHFFETLHEGSAQSAMSRKKIVDDCHQRCHVRFFI
jgi:zinc transporter